VVEAATDREVVAVDLLYVRRDDLARAVRVAGAAQGEIRLRHGLPRPHPNWVRCSDLLADLGGWADRVTAWLKHEYGEAPDRVVAGYLLSWYLTVPAQAAALLFHTARRVPALGPTDLAVRFADDSPRPVETALLGDAFACLADDPAAHSPHATPLAGDAPLAAVLRGRYAAHAARFLTALGDALGERIRFGRHTLWASATDALDGAFWRTGQYCGNESAGATNAALVLPGALAPFTSGSTLRPAAGTDSADAWTRRRESCCFHYVLRSGVGTCATCPRVAMR
jgi:hypothetical protein